MNEDRQSGPTQRPPVPDCPLCDSAGGHDVWSDADWRAIRVQDDAFPAFYRLIANRHVREFSDLSPAARLRCMDLVCAIERTMIERLGPTKMNLASLGNVVPHLHWHIVARFDWDSHFPEPIWAAPLRSVEPSPCARLAATLASLDSYVARALSLLTHG